MTADKMFEELGYTKMESLDTFYYSKTEQHLSMTIYNFIGFNQEKQKIDIYAQDVSRGGRYEFITKILTIPELKAINEKVKELGWLEKNEEYLEETYEDTKNFEQKMNID